MLREPRHRGRDAEQGRELLAARRVSPHLSSHTETIPATKGKTRLTLPHSGPLARSAMAARLEPPDSPVDFPTRSWGDKGAVRVPLARGWAYRKQNGLGACLIRSLIAGATTAAGGKFSLPFLLGEWSEVVEP